MLFAQGTVNGGHTVTVIDVGGGRLLIDQIPHGLNLKNSQTRAGIKLNRTVTPAAQTPVKSQNATTSNLKARLFWKDVRDRKEHSRI